MLLFHWIYWTVYSDILNNFYLCLYLLIYRCSLWKNLNDIHPNWIYDKIIKKKMIKLMKYNKIYLFLLWPTSFLSANEKTSLNCSSSSSSFTISACDWIMKVLRIFEILLAVFNWAFSFSSFAVFFVFLSFSMVSFFFSNSPVWISSFLAISYAIVFKNCALTNSLLLGISMFRLSVSLRIVGRMFGLYTVNNLHFFTSSNSPIFSNSWVLAVIGGWRYLGVKFVSKSLNSFKNLETFI